MSMLPKEPGFIQSRDYRAALNAVLFGQASWLHSRPIEEAVAVRVGRASWLSSRPRAEEISCLRCDAQGELSYRRDGILEIEQCSSCGGSGKVDVPTAETLRGLMGLAAERQPFDLLDDEAFDFDVPYFEPSPEDEIWRALAERPTFVDKLFAYANIFIDSDDPDVRWMGEHFAEMAYEARALDARTGGEFIDRKDAMRRAGY